MPANAEPSKEAVKPHHISSGNALVSAEFSASCCELEDMKGATRSAKSKSSTKDKLVKHEFSVGENVWVRSGETQEEPAVIVDFLQNINNDKKEEEEDDDTSEDDDMILVKYTTGNYEAVVQVSQVRKMVDLASNGGGARRSSRRRTRAASPMTPDVTVSASKSGNGKNRAVSVVTPSPAVDAESTVLKKRGKKISKKILKEEEEEETVKQDCKEHAKEADEEEQDVKQEDVEEKKQSASLSVVSVSSDSSDDDKPVKALASKNKATSASAKGKPKQTDTKKNTKKDATGKKKPAKAASIKKDTKKTKPKPKPKAKTAKPKKTAVKDENNTKNQREEEEEDNDSTGSEEENYDNPEGFFVEYSKTGRATCRRCDERIEKGDLRIGHTPLFRGKPGYVVYRHIQCAIFCEQITHPKQIRGYSKLTRTDKTTLTTRITTSALEVQQEREELEPDELVPLTFQGEIRKSPPGLTADLLPFQVEGVSWMYAQECVSDVKGGMLADEMGMGKTLQTITTILDHRPKLQHVGPGSKCPPDATKEYRSKAKMEEDKWKHAQDAWSHEMEMQNVIAKIRPKGGPKRGGTLVVCPVIALTQWKTEIERFAEKQALTVGTYHGPNRASGMPREVLCKYDVVLTTYQVLEADMRKMVSPNRVTCPNCGGKFKLDKLRIHLKYFCGENAQRTEAQARQRRSAERHVQRVMGRQRPGGGPSGGGGGGAGNSKTSKKSAPKKKSFTSKTSTKTSPQATPEKRIRVSRKAGSDMDSESELSAMDDEDAKPLMTPTGKRRARSAAVHAVKKMAQNLSDFSDNEEEEDSYEESASAEESEEEDDEEYGSGPPVTKSAGKSKKTTKAMSKKMPAKSKGKKKTAKKALAGRKRAAPSSSEDESDDEEDQDRLALQLQQEALEASGKSTKRKTFAKKPPQTMEKKGASKKIGKKTAKTNKMKKGSKNKGKKPPLKKGKKVMKGKKKSFGDGDDPSSSSDSDSDSESDSDKDVGWDEVDMDELVAEAMAGSKMSVLHSILWWRVVLDEAHFIKSRSSQTAQAAFALIGVHRWCLSGTPLQNRVGEFYSLIRFLRIDPMAHYFCRSSDCNCKSLHYRMMDGKCQDCGHGSVQHFSHFNKYVLNPIQRDGYSGDGRRAMFILKNEVLDKCLLRRTKENKAEDMNLPPRIVNIRYIRLHPVEEDFYNALYTQGRSSFDDYVTNGTLLNNYAHIFDLLMRMRQSVDHPYLVVYSKRGDLSGGASAVVHGGTDCAICSEDITDRVSSTCCNTAFCRSCVMEYMTTSTGLSQASNGIPCPSCREPFSIDLNRVEEVVETQCSSVGMPSLRELSHVPPGSILRRLNLTEFATSTKIEALTAELVRMRQKNPGGKAIVFSQFVNMLDLIRWRLHSDPCLVGMGLGAVALHGSMDVKARDESLRAFREDSDVRVLLMSLKAGGVALNLTVANHIYLMDPWWNPAAEMQAIDRTHRLGQYRPIRAVRFIAENTVEERILQLQEKKRLVFDGTVGRDAGSLKMLTVDDMKSLFA